MTEAPIKPPAKGMSKTAIIAVVIAAIVIVAAVVIVVEERKAVTPTTGKNVEFYTYWSTTGKVALDKMSPAFHNATGLTLSPYISPGAGGVNAKYAILSLIEAGVPPATFQTHYGTEMLSYVEAAPNGTNSFVNLGPVANQMNLTNNSFPEVIESGTFNGTTLSLPVDLHQGAQLYFNPGVLKRYHQSIPTTLPQLVNVTKNLTKDGQVAWVIPGGDGGFDQIVLWGDILLAVAGNQLYDQFTYGIMSQALMHDINVTNNYFSIFNNNSYSGEQSLTWTQAVPLINNGTVAFQDDGNWETNYAYDYLNTTNYPAIAPYTSWTNISLMSSSFPGTGKYFEMISDSVAVPKGKTQSNGLAFAKYFASFAGQKIFTKWKAVTFYNNVTNDYFNTPAQWYSYQQAKSTPANDWVYQLQAGMFDGPTATFESALISFYESFSSGGSNSTYLSASSTLDHAIQNVLSTTYQDWHVANGLGLGYLGYAGHPFGGYLPPWANTSANRTSPSYTLVKDNSVHSNAPAHKDATQYANVSPFSISYLENMVATGITTIKY